MKDMMVRIDRPIYSDTIDFHVREYLPGGAQAWLPSEIKTQAVTEYHMTDPWLSIPRYRAIHFIKAMIEAFSEDQWIRTKIVEDTREKAAMQSNLTDLRQITDRLFDVLARGK